MNGAILRMLLNYNPTTGKLYWKHRNAAWFKNCSQSVANQWNAKHESQEAFTSTDAAGYHHGTIFGKQYYAHRVIWCMVYDEWPVEIDHQDGCNSNNKLLNLIDGSHRSNMMNVKLRCDNHTGFVGIAWDQRRNKWTARIHVNGRNLFIGSFVDLDNAVSARQAAERRHRFHINHGKR